MVHVRGHCVTGFSLERCRLCCPPFIRQRWRSLESRHTPRKVNETKLAHLLLSFIIPYSWTFRYHDSSRWVAEEDAVVGDMETPGGECEDATKAKELPQGWEVLAKGKPERLMLFLHNLLQQKGCTAVAGTEEAWEVPGVPKGWNTAGVVFCFRYSYPEREGTLVVAALVASGTLSVTAKVEPQAGKEGKEIASFTFATASAEEKTIHESFWRAVEPFLSSLLSAVKALPRVATPGGPPEEFSSLRVEPTRRMPPRHVRPPLYDPSTGLEVGADDLSPFGSSQPSPFAPCPSPGGGSQVGPNHPMFRGPPQGRGGPYGPPGPGAFHPPPPGARFDPLGPFGGGPGNPPGPDHLRPPTWGSGGSSSNSWDSMFM